MSRMSMTQEERDARLREIESGLDDDLGLDDVAVETTVPRKAKGGLQNGKVALISLAVFLLTRVVGTSVINVVMGVALISAVVFGILWVIGLFRD